MKEIQLTRGKVALVDDEDYDQLMAMGSWYAEKCNGGNFYARIATKRINGKQFKLLMHRVILKVSQEVLVDHRDGNGLNNQKSNLRPCTYIGNAQNRKIDKDSLSGYKGVSQLRGKWMARIKFDGKKQIYLGIFLTPIEAARAYNAAAILHHGEFARLNEIPV